MTNRRPMKLALSVAAIAATSAIAVPAAANAATPAVSSSPVVTSSSTASASVTAREVSTALTSAAGGLSAADWRQVEKNARKAGDTAGASAVDRYLSGRTTKTNGIKTKLVKILLRHGGPALAKALKKASPRAAQWIEKNSGKLANWLDEVEGFSELAITTFLSHNGVDPTVAHDVARWIVLFAG